MELITYEQIENANKAIKTTEIKGKDYAEVNQRIKAFRMCYPNGKIETTILSHDNGVILMQAKIYDSNDRIIGTGLAQEKESSSFINKTSYIENCETSAVGRALGMCGFGIDVSVASAEEEQNAINNQEPKEQAKEKKTEPKKAEMLATEKQLEMIKNLYSVEEVDKMLVNLNKNFYEITVQEASKMIKARKDKQNGSN